MTRSYATTQSRGRLYREADKLPFLSPFAIDRSQVIESTAFRRLEYKTQVFIYNEGDHYRNRLTHSLEAAQISRIIAKALGINEDLAETLALAHDLGHAPFGHAGEEALNSNMEKYGLQFDHNSHAIKLITKLEQRHPQFDGLNLTWETIEGLAKHNGPISSLHPNDPIFLYNQKHNLDLDRYPSLEAQVASIADDIAYNNHDIDDGFRAGLISIDDLEEIGFIGDNIERLKKEFPTSECYKIVHEAIRLVKNKMINDVITQTQINIQKYKIKTDIDIRSIDKKIAEFSPEMENYHQAIKLFLSSKVYKSKSVKIGTNRGQDIIKELFALYIRDPVRLPRNWYDKVKLDEKNLVTHICDFIACMSDKYAIKTYNYFSSM